MSRKIERAERINIHPGEILNEDFILPLGITRHSDSAVRRYHHPVLPESPAGLRIEKTRADHGALIDAITSLASA